MENVSIGIRTYNPPRVSKTQRNSVPVRYCEIRFQLRQWNQSVAKVIDFTIYLNPCIALAKPVEINITFVFLPP
jgi:hypothetical protein